MLKENAKLPELRLIYPFTPFIPDDQWDEQNRDVADGLKELIQMVDTIKPSNGDVATEADIRRAYDAARKSKAE